MCEEAAMRRRILAVFHLSHCLSMENSTRQAFTSGTALLEGIFQAQSPAKEISKFVSDGDAQLC